MTFPEIGAADKILVLNYCLMTYESVLKTRPDITLNGAISDFRPLLRNRNKFNRNTSALKYKMIFY